MGGCQCIKNGNSNDKNEIVSTQVPKNKNRQTDNNCNDISGDLSKLDLNLSSSVIIKEGKIIGNIRQSES